MKKLPMTNRRPSYWGPSTTDRLVLNPPVLSYPTADSTRVRADSEEYTTDNNGD